MSTGTVAPTTAPDSEVTLAGGDDYPDLLCDCWNDHRDESEFEDCLRDPEWRVTVTDIRPDGSSKPTHQDLLLLCNHCLEVWQTQGGSDGLPFRVLGRL